jgi:tRNA nucleotidyltransferase (CCA-adding enzyme)
MYELGIAERAPQPLLLGRHVLALGLSPGKRVGEITRAIYERQLDGQIVTLDQAIQAAQQLISQNISPK